MSDFLDFLAIEPQIPATPPPRSLPVSPQEPAPLVVHLSNPTDNRVCQSCETEFPKSLLYFKPTNQKGAFSKSCHECVFNAKVAQGKAPMYPAKNGIDQKQYHEQLKASASSSTSSSPPPKTPVKKVNFDDPISKDSPWNKKTTAPQPSDLAPPKQSPESHILPQTKKAFNLDPHISRHKNSYVLTINDYFKMKQFHNVPANSKSPPQKTIKKSQPQLATPDQSSNEEYQSEPEEIDEATYNLQIARSELLKDTVTYPATSEKLGLSLEGVQQLTDEECLQWWDISTSINQIVTAGAFLRDVVSLFAGAAETIDPVPLTENFHLDLNGWSQDIKESENVAACFNEICRENEELVEEYVNPYFKLAVEIFSIGLNRTRSNNHKRLVRLEKENVLRTGQFAPRPPK